MTTAVLISLKAKKIQENQSLFVEKIEPKQKELKHPFFILSKYWVSSQITDDLEKYVVSLHYQSYELQLWRR